MDSTTKSGEVSLNAFVFIARDDGEYRRYVLAEGTGEVAGRDLSTRGGLFQWRYCPQTHVLRFVASKQAFGEDRGYKKLAPAIEGGELCQFLYRYLAEDKKERDDARSRVGACAKSIFIGHHDRSLIKLLYQLKDADEKAIVPENDAGNYYIFIHLGGVEGQYIKFFEETMRKKMPDNWRIFSIGTDRNDLFDVSKTPIVIPVNMEAVYQRFAAAQQFSNIKDVLTAYVREAIGEDEMGQIGAFLARDTIHSDLRAAMDNPQAKWLRGWKAFLDYLEAASGEKTKVAALRMLQAEGDAPRMLVSQLLTIPQLLSEDLFR